MRTKTILTLLSLFVLATSCSKTDKSTGSVEILVKDGTQWSLTNTEGVAVADAEVTLYTKPGDYRNNAPAFSGKTDGSGKVVFKGLEPGDYFYIVRKGDKLSFFEPLELIDHPIAFIPKGIFQNGAQITSTPHLPGTEPGDFIFADGNGDGILNDHDKRPVPFGVTVTAGKTTHINSLIGYTFNHTSALFQNKEHAQQVLDNLYLQVADWHKLQVVMDGMLSDDASCIGMPDWCPLDNFTFTSSERAIGTFWQKAYTNISQFNRVIMNVPKLNLPADEAGKMIAQAKGMRGYTYMLMAAYFGGVPLQEGTAAGVDIMRAPLNTVFEQVEKDLAEAAGVLPSTWSGADQRRISAHACKLLLARLAILQNNPLRAAQYSAELVQSGKYRLVDRSQIFVSDDNAEIIWNMAPGIPLEYTAFFNYWGARNFAPALRYAEVLLINSEANILLNNLNTVAQYLNNLRDRHSQPPLTLTNSLEATSALRSTWQIEQHREGQRFLKLVQWGIARDALGSNGLQLHHQKLPIPWSVLNSSRYMQQNPGY